MKKTRILLVVPAILVILAVLSGCVSVDEKQIFDKPAFNNSHAILIEKTIREVPVQDLFADEIGKNERVIVASMEDVMNDQTGLVPLIEDNLILNLSEMGYSVMEREDRVLGQLEKERGSLYTSFAERDLPISPILNLIHEMNAQGLNYLDFNEVLAASERSVTINGDDARAALDIINPAIYKDILEFYKTLDASYFEKQAIAVTDVELQTADVLVSYRVLECGIFVDIEKTEFEKQEQSMSARMRLAKPDMLTNTKYTREANARMFIRIIDAKTGEIRGAKLVENINTDTIEYKQGEKETGSDYRRRMREYEALLANYHYTYYDQQYPLQRTKQDQEVFEKAVVNDDKSDTGLFSGFTSLFKGEEASSDSDGEGVSLFDSADDGEAQDWTKWVLPIAGGLAGITVIGLIIAYI